MIEEPDQAIDFFHGFEQAKYGEFELNVPNGWAIESMKPPEAVNEIYWLAGVWVNKCYKREWNGSNLPHGSSQKRRDWCPEE